MVAIYVQLLDEGTDVWRPVEATQVSGETYRIEGDTPEGEVWEFPSGSIVTCDWKTFGGGDRGLIAVSLVGAE